jgi:hypothetical protein
MNKLRIAIKVIKITKLNYEAQCTLVAVFLPLN